MDSTGRMAKSVFEGLLSRHRSVQLLAKQRKGFTSYVWTRCGVNF
jgi:hypothetical protein